MIVSQLDNTNYFVCRCDDYGGSMPHGCIAAAPPSFPWNNTWAHWNGKHFVLLPDHRQRRVEEGFAPELVQEATEYWLPPPYGEDTHQSPPRTMTERGPLPEGALLTQPLKPLTDAQDEKRQEITRAHGEVLSYLLAESPSPTAVEAALAVEDMRDDDPEGLRYVRGLADARRAELLAAVDAAQSVPAVEAIVVSYPV